MTRQTSRRQFVRDLGLSAAALPFVANLPSLGYAADAADARRKQRLIVMFSPNGIVPKNFWPDKQGEDFDFKPILKPLEQFRDKTLILHGMSVKLRGDGDNHMRGIGCLLTGIELFPGNIQGGSHTPAGWASGQSIDQEIRNFLQKDPATRTRFGSLEFGVMVPDKADTWTRLSYAGANKPLAPIDDPYQMFDKLYGRLKDRAVIASVLDDLQQDMKTLRGALGANEQRLLDEHAQRVREMERELQDAANQPIGHAVPKLEAGVEDQNDNMPKISKMQIDLLVNSFAADFTRVATLQYTNSVGQARMKWIGVDKGHHSLSHASDNDKSAQNDLTKINTWYCEQMAYLAKRLAETPEPDGNGTLLDNTTIVWTNELGKGNSHTLNDIPFVMVGGGLGFKTGRAMRFRHTAHNRLLMSFAHAFGHRIDKFGNPDLCGGGPLDLG